MRISDWSSDVCSSDLTYVVDTGISRPTSITNGTGQTTTFQYDGSARRTRPTFPEGNYIQWTYDSRGNVTEERHVAKSGAGLGALVKTRYYDATCPHPNQCTNPNSTVAERSNHTQQIRRPPRGARVGTYD